MEQREFPINTETDARNSLLHLRRAISFCRYPDRLRELKAAEQKIYERFPSLRPQPPP